MKPGFLSVVRREIRRLTSRPLYAVAMIAVPLLMAFFFVGMMHSGLPLKVPSGVVDMDHSQMSRTLIRSLDAMELIDVVQQPVDYHTAMEAVQRGEIIGFFMIPEDFERDAISNRAPALTYYYNTAIYVPGSLAFKGFKTMGVSSSGALVQTSLTARGISSSVAGVILQPMTVNVHALNNPYLNYSYYLSPSFTYGLLELMIFLVTSFSITQELKTYTSREWLNTAGNRVGVALLGKLLPQTIVFVTVGLFINALLFGYLHFPMNGSMLWMNIGMLLFVIASQSVAVFVCAIIPNARFAMSICSLMGILAFSLAAFSFPVEAMYGALVPFTTILPVRWYFLIYANEALNGIALYYSRFYFIWLLCFPIAASLAAWRLRKPLLNPVYVP